MARPKSNQEDEIIDNKSIEVVEAEKVSKPHNLLDLIKEDLIKEDEEFTKSNINIDISKEKYVLFDKENKCYVLFNSFAPLKHLIIYNNNRYSEPDDRIGLYWNLLNIKEQTLSELNSNSKKSQIGMIESAERLKRAEELKNNLKQI